jgi:hypothetical protein
MLVQVSSKADDTLVGGRVATIVVVVVGATDVVGAMVEVGATTDVFAQAARPQAASRIGMVNLRTPR